MVGEEMRALACTSKAQIGSGMGYATGSGQAEMISLRRSGPFGARPVAQVKGPPATPLGRSGRLQNQTDELFCVACAADQPRRGLLRGTIRERRGSGALMTASPVGGVRRKLGSPTHCRRRKIAQKGGGTTLARCLGASTGCRLARPIGFPGPEQSPNRISAQCFRVVRISGRIIPRFAFRMLCFPLLGTHPIGRPLVTWKAWEQFIERGSPGNRALAPG